MLRIPCFYFCNLLLIESDKVTQSTGLDVNGILQYCLSGSILQCISDGAGSSRRTFHRHFQIEDTFFVFLFIKGSTYFIVSNILFGSAIQINIPFDTADTPEVLTFQIRTCAPTEDFQCKYILTRFHVFVDQEFCGVLGIFAVSYFLSVDVYIYT